MFLVSEESKREKQGVGSGRVGVTGRRRGADTSEQSRKLIQQRGWSEEGIDRMEKILSRGLRGKTSMGAQNIRSAMRYIERGRFMKVQKEREDSKSDG